MNIETLILDLIANGSTHGLLIVAIIVLWRENRRLQAKLESVREVVASTHALTVRNADNIASVQKVIGDEWPEM